MTPDLRGTPRELLDELDLLSAALEEAWREILPDEDPRIPVLRDVVASVPAMPADESTASDDRHPDAASSGIEDAAATIIDELIADWLPRIESELRSRLLEHARHCDEPSPGVVHHTLPDPDPSS